MDSLCSFLGRQTTNDLLLSHMITYLNDRDWALRWAFFDGIVVVATNLVQKDVEEYILPLLIQALSGMLTCRRVIFKYSTDEFLSLQM